jgi:DNA-binding protein Fis
MTTSFMGLASYLVMVGIYSSSICLSQDSTLRQHIRKFAEKESRLLDSIGIAQMEQEIQQMVIKFTKQNQDKMAEESGVYSSLTEDDVKVYLEQVIKEVRKNHNKKP